MRLVNLTTGRDVEVGDQVTCVETKGTLVAGDRATVMEIIGPSAIGRQGMVRVQWGSPDTDSGIYYAAVFNCEVK